MCFDPHFLLTFAIIAIVVIAAVLILRLVIPAVAPNLASGPPGLFMQIVWIVVGAAIAIAILIFLWDLIACLIGGVRIR